VIYFNQSQVKPIRAVSYQWNMKIINFDRHCERFDRHCERSKAIPSRDCFVACAPRKDKGKPLACAQDKPRNDR